MKYIMFGMLWLICIFTGFFAGILFSGLIKQTVIITFPKVMFILILLWGTIIACYYKETYEAKLISEIKIRNKRIEELEKTSEIT